MPDVLIYADSIRSPEMRHEVPVLVPDPFLYGEAGGLRFASAVGYEADRLRAAAELTVVPWEELGYDELLAEGRPRHEVELEVAARACERLGVAAPRVPPDFPLALADVLRSRGIDPKSDHELFVERRRVKTPAELAGIRSAQRGAEAGMAAAAELLRRARPNGTAVLLDGEPLTCERLRAAVERAFSEHGVTADEVIVSHGRQTAIGHEAGSGPIAPGEAVLLDLFPRDRESGCHADMTRTFVVGEPPAELREYHRLCREALELATAAIRPGADGREVYRLVCELFHEHGYPTQLSKPPGEPLEEGFYHGLGHGVGLDVHEEPRLGRSGRRLVAGDVLAVEPGLYRPDLGGVRLEDLVLVTEQGAEVLTDFPYGLEP